MILPNQSHIITNIRTMSLKCQYLFTLFAEVNLTRMWGFYLEGCLTAGGV